MLVQVTDQRAKAPVQLYARIADLLGLLHTGVLLPSVSHTPTTGP
jgi:hypothetical protein